MNGGNNVDIEQVIALTREIAALGAKMENVQGSIRSLESQLASTYVPRAEIEEKFKAQGERIGKLEAAPHRWVSTGIAIAAAAASVAALFTK